MKELHKTENIEVGYLEDRGIVYMQCSGQITLDELKTGIDIVDKVAAGMNTYHLIFNFKKVKNVSADARAWFQYDFLAHEGAELLGRVNKMAVIRPNRFLSSIQSSVIVEIFIEMLLKTCKDLKCMSFNSVNRALDWIDPGFEPHERIHSLLWRIFPNILRSVWMRNAENANMARFSKFTIIK